MSNLGSVLQREWGVGVGTDNTRARLQASVRAPPAHATTPLLETVHACGCFVAISLSFVVYGVLQERMMTVGFGDKQELFSWSLFIVFCNRFLTCIISFGLLVIQRKSITPVAPIPAYAAVSFGNLVASTCQYDSLKYISFAMQTLAKCCKMLPVMLWGALIGRQRYSAKELAVAGAVMAGCASFIFSGSVLSATVPEVQSSRYYAIGAGLLLLYLTFDGFTSTWQDKLFQGYEMDTSNQVLYTTLCSTIMSFVILVGSSDMAAATAFLKRNPQAWVYILAVSSVAAIIQYFVSYTIKVYGALNFAALMTARQFLSIIASCIIFNHSFSVGQWAGTAIVFGALAIRMSDKRHAHMRKDASVQELSSSALHTQVGIPTGSAHKQARRSPGMKGMVADHRLANDHTLGTRPVLIPSTPLVPTMVEAR